MTMNEIEEKYSKFALNERIKEMFCHFSIGINGKSHDTASYVITTIQIDQTGELTKIEENKNAKLV